MLFINIYESRPSKPYEPFLSGSELGDGVSACHSAFRQVMGTGTKR